MSDNNHHHQDSQSNNTHQSGTSSSHNSIKRRPSGYGINVPATGADSHHALNSFDHFATSYTRAQSFLAIEPPNELSRPRAFFVDEEEAIGSSPPEAFVDNNRHHRLGSHRRVSGSIERPAVSSGRRHSFSARFFHEGSPAIGGLSESNESAIDDHDEDTMENAPLIPHHRSHSNFNRRASYLAPPESGATLLIEGEAVAPGTETEPVIVRTIEDKDGKVSTEVVGQSTVPQTIFNSINVLIGVGLLSLPLGFKMSGWALGLFLLTFTGITTQYTAYLLAKCMDTDPTLVTYADISYAAFGPRARVLTSILFSFELTGAGVSFVILFADSLNALFPHIDKTTFKLLALACLTPPCFLPLRILSVSSIFGIFSSVGVLVIVFFDGVYKQEAPGSLWSPEATSITPTSWRSAPLAIGIFMALWAGHAVFPNIYRDMRHPNKYKGALATIYQITFGVNLTMGVIGYLMFGQNVDNEVTKNIMFTPGYPEHQGVVITSLISLIPLAKTPLCARPIISTVDIFSGLHHVPMSFAGMFAGRLSLKQISQRVAKGFVRFGIISCLVILAIAFPDFDRIIAFLGASLCISICVLGPIAFYLSIYGDNVPAWERKMDYVLFVIYVILAVLGTIWCFIPKE